IVPAAWKIRALDAFTKASLKIVGFICANQIRLIDILVDLSWRITRLYAVFMRKHSVLTSR
ncbi:MAG: hypothetical protein K2X81_00355, partial [Candidatus Obscuribacterales bacterium]|nr:hypothetical protein [Candidatus Obscuribacterales bacterium]